MGLPRGGIPHDSGFSGTFPLDWPLSPGWSPRRPLWAAGTLTQLCCRGLSRAFLLPPGHILDAMAAEGPPGPALPGSPEMAARGGLPAGRTRPAGRRVGWMPSWGPALWQHRLWDALPCLLSSHERAATGGQRRDRLQSEVGSPSTPDPESSPQLLGGCGRVCCLRLLPTPVQLRGPLKAMQCLPADPRLAGALFRTLEQCLAARWWQGTHGQVRTAPLQLSHAPLLPGGQCSGWGGGAKADEWV